MQLLERQLLRGHGKVVPGAGLGGRGSVFSGTVSVGDGETGDGHTTLNACDVTDGYAYTWMCMMYIGNF